MEVSDADRSPEGPSGPVTSAMREADIRPKPLLDEFFVRLKRDAARLVERRSEFVEVKCGFCAGSSRELAFEKEGFAYCHCLECGSLFVSPRPTMDLLHEYMDTSEAVAFWSSHFYRETAAARREQLFRPRARVCREIADRHLGDGPLRFADVGAGYGLFLAELSHVVPSWVLTAVEPDARLAAICREQGFETVERWVEDIGDRELDFDFISAFEVLEHVYDPIAFLTSCRRLLRPGGYALVTTLTISGFDLQILGSRSRSISPPQHLNFPAVSALAATAAHAGFDMVDVGTPGILDLDIVRNVIQADPTVDLPAFVRTLASADDATRQSFQTFLVAQRMSSHVRCLLRRPPA